MSDLHVGRRRRGMFRQRDRNDAVARCVAKINSVAPDVVLATGDLTHTGDTQEYLRLRELLAALNAPVFLLPGNHDSRRALRNAFPDHAYLFETTPYIAYTIDAGPLRIVALDSTQPRRTGGYLDDARLSWLQGRLEEARPRPTLLAMHHPPFETGVWPMDSFGFVHVDALDGIVKKNPHVKRIVSGHVHCAISAQWGQTLACTSPPPFFMVLLRLTPRARLRPAFEPPGFLLHTCDETERVTTRVVRLNGVTEPM